MIFAESFECRIPSESAVKSDVIYCSAPPSGGWEITGFLVDASAALGTLASVGIAVWVALDARKRVAEERGRAERAERENRIRDARAKVISAISAYVENIESEDQSKFYAIPDALLNMSLAHTSDDKEGLALYGALNRVYHDLLEPVFVGYMQVRMADRYRRDWDNGIRFWQGKLNAQVSKIRNLFDALNASTDPEIRAGLICYFAEEVGLAAKSLKASMSIFTKEEW